MKKANLGSLFLLLVLAGSLTLNVHNALALKGLRSPTRTNAGGLHANVEIQSIPALDGAGQPIEITFRDRGDTVLYVLSPSCPWCERNAANMLALRVAAVAKGYRFIALSTSARNYASFVRANGYPFPIYLLRSSASVSAMRLEATPQTALIDSRGWIRKVWVGAYTPDQAAEIQTVFSFSLPGLQSPTLTPMPANGGTR